MVIPYPYLWLDLLMLGGVSLTLGLAPPPLRRIAVRAGYVSIPSALASVAFVPDYWAPECVLPWSVTLEDILFAFWTGALCFLMAAWPFRYELQETPDGAAPRRVAICYTAGAMVFLFLLKALGLSVMPAALWTIAIVAAPLAIQRPELRPLALTGLATFPLVYLVLLLAGLGLFPHFLSQWNHTALSGLRILGTPIEELAWAVCAGAAWPVLACHMLGVRRQSHVLRHRRPLACG